MGSWNPVAGDDKEKVTPAYTEDQIIDTIFGDDVGELPDDPWQLIEGVNLSRSRSDEIIKSIEKDEEIDDLSFSGDEFDDGATGFQRLKGIGKLRDQVIEAMFDDETQRQLALLLKYRINDACQISSSVETRKKAIKWIFCSSDSTMTEICVPPISFRDTLSVFGARHYVIQTRVVYQLYRNCIPLRTPLPFLADGLPEIIENELYGNFGVDNANNAVLLARTAWLWPGIRIDILKEECLKGWFQDGDPFDELINKMADRGYIGIANAFVFMICRNPSLKNLKNYSWSYNL